MAAPSLSICIPTYNRASLLRICLESVARQTYRDFEVIISDNASTDATAEVVREYCGGAWSYHRNKVNLGYVRNLNACVSKASGKLIHVVYDDDVLYPHASGTLVGMLAANPHTAFAFSAADFIDGSGAGVGRFVPWADDQLFIGHDFVRSELNSPHVLASTVMMRHDAYQRVGGFDEAFRIVADWEMWLRLASDGDVAYTADRLVQHRLHVGSMGTMLQRNDDEAKEYRKQYVASEAGPNASVLGIEEIGRMTDKILRLPATAQWRDADSIRRRARRRWAYSRASAIAGTDMRTLRSQLIDEVRADPGLVTDWRVGAAWLVSWLGPRRLAALKQAKSRLVRKAVRPVEPLSEGGM